MRWGTIAALSTLAVLAGCGGDAPPAVSLPAGSSTAAPGAILPPAFPVAGAPPLAGHPWYLALGDSITAGFSIDPDRRGTNSSWALQLQPLLAASGRRWSLYDLACTGEDTITFRTGCRAPSRPPALRSASQHDAALQVIQTNGADLRLILIDLGSNDLLRAARGGITAPAAATATASMVANLRGIIGELITAAPGVPVVMTTFYDPLALSDPTTLPFLQAANLQLRRLGADLHIAVADFGAAINGGDGRSTQLCRWVDCAHLDIHPTVVGHARLAATALAAIPR